MFTSLDYQCRGDVTDAVNVSAGSSAARLAAGPKVLRAKLRRGGVPLAPVNTRSLSSRPPSRET